MENNKKEFNELYNSIQEKFESIKTDLVALNDLFLKKDEINHIVDIFEKERFLINFFSNIFDNEPRIYLDKSVYDSSIYYKNKFINKFNDLFDVLVFDIQKNTDLNYISNIDVSKIIYSIVNNYIDLFGGEYDNVNIILDNEYIGFSFIYNNQCYIVKLNDNNVINCYIDNNYKQEPINKEHFQEYINKQY